MTFKLRDVQRLLALSIPSELAYEITGYLVQSDIREPPREVEYDFVPRVRHRYLLNRFEFDVDL